MLWLLLSSAVADGEARLRVRQGCGAFSKGNQWVPGMIWLKRRDAPRRDQKCSYSDNWDVSLALGVYK